MKKFFEDFKAFALKGNVVDMAVGVVIGGAFGKIVTSLVNDIIMPALSLLTGKVNLAELSYVLKAAEGEEAAEIVLSYGLFLQNILDFLLIALSIFVVIKLMASMHKKKEEEAVAAPEPEPVPTNEEVLLTEIRDLLKKQ